MSESEPALLRDQPDAAQARSEAAGDASAAGAASTAQPASAAGESETKPASPASDARPAQPARPSRRETPTVYVAGFWKRLAAAVIDLGIVIPSSLLITIIASTLGGVPLPPSNLAVLDWIDLVLAAHPALVMGAELTLAIGLTYLLVFQIVLGRTLGMRVLGLKIIDAYGDRPSPARCVARCAGYLAGVASLFLGFLWIGFDAEKRGLHDWIAGTYVIRA